jgi:hypothetical protein
MFFLILMTTSRLLAQGNPQAVQADATLDYKHEVVAKWSICLSLRNVGFMIGDKGSPSRSKWFLDFF